MNTETIMLIETIALFTIQGFVSAYVFCDAKRREMNPYLWTLFSFVAPILIGFAIYLFARKENEKNWWKGILAIVISLVLLARLKMIPRLATATSEEHESTVSMEVVTGSYTISPVNDVTDANMEDVKEMVVEEIPEPKSTPAILSGDLVLYSSMGESDIDALVSSFNEVYPNVRVEIINDSLGNLLARIEDEVDNPVGDLIWGGLSAADGDKYADIFEPWISVYANDYIDCVTDTNNMYSYDHISTVVFLVNEELEAELGLDIDSYEDLLDPALEGLLVMAEPSGTSLGWNNLSNIMAVYGEDSIEAWEYIYELKSNLEITSSSSKTLTGVRDGEYVVGLTYEDGAASILQNGNGHLRIQYPEEGTSGTVFGTALIKNGPNAENAKAMIDFICSAEGQTAISAYQGGTMRYCNAEAQLPTNSELADSDEINWIERDVEYLEENKESILSHWDEIIY